MGCVILFLVGLNFVSLRRWRSQSVITNTELFVELLLDVAALTAQLYLSGGATNPFVSLFLLQVILGAVLLQPLSTWTLVAVTSGCFLWLIGSYREIGLSTHDRQHDIGQSRYFDLHVDGMFICFLLAVVLLVLFITRINQNLRNQDRRLSELRQQSAEEEYIVRMGLLASGAAHELGTPLATLSVILNDWERMPALHADHEIGTEIGEMQMALARCKHIVSRILLAAGEARSEKAERTTLVDFLDDVVADWQETRGPPHLDYVNTIASDTAIVSDTMIRQILFNVFDNALEASPDWVGIEVSRRDDRLAVTVRDKGVGFTADILANFGKPYQSTKQRSGSGLGLFLVVNVLRKLGGTVVPHNLPEGGAAVELCLPIGAVSIEGEEHDAVG
ncbi:MAG: HAMP domain-containing sensor histidine kinase [Acetobacteraceae bacterium]